MNPGRRPLHFDIAEARALRAVGYSFYRIGRMLGVDATSIRYWLDPAAAERVAETNRKWQEDARRPGVTVTFANKTKTAYVTVAANGPGGAEANLRDLLDAVPMRWYVLTVSTPRTIMRDLRGQPERAAKGNPSKARPELAMLGRIERIGRLHPDLWPRQAHDRRYFERAAARPLGKGKGRNKARAS
jgi:hypothetical protein